MLVQQGDCQSWPSKNEGHDDRSSNSGANLFVSDAPLFDCFGSCFLQVLPARHWVALVLRFFKVMP